MSIQQPPIPATMMTETSVIKHYKKRLIYRQHDTIDSFEKNRKDESKTPSNNNNNNKEESNKKTRRKRKNKNCRGQFRHEDMELIKLGGTPPHRTKDPLLTPPPKTNLNKPILSPPPLYPHHTLPQMVPERRPSREFPPSKPPLLYPEPDYPIPPPYFPPRAIPYRPTPSYLSPPQSPVRPIPQFPRIHYPVARHAQYQPGPTGLERGKRKLEDEKQVTSQVIDLTVEGDQVKRHKCQCECGKTYTSDPATKQVTVPSGHRANGVLQFGSKEQMTSESTVVKVNGDGTTPPDEKVPLPPLFLIKDLLAKGVKIEHNGHQKKPTMEPSVIVKNQAIGPPTRRQSVEIDTISISSSCSEPMTSPRSKSNSIEKQIPQGKLFFYKANNSLIRYFDDAQKKMFFDSISSDGDVKNGGPGEPIELPKHIVFSGKDSLTVEEYVLEMDQVEKYIPRDFFLFYRFVTGYQICNNNLPVSFLTFLKVYNTNGLKVLLEKYVNELKQQN